MIEMIQKDLHGLIRMYEIPEEWAQDTALFDAWWLPKTELGSDGLYHIVEPARVSDEAKAQRLVVPPVENIITNAGITLILTNLSVQVQASMQAVTEILSVGNGAITGVTRGDTAVAGDAFVASARKAPASFSTVGFLTTIITNFASGDAVGTWTNIGWYGFKVAGSQNATTTAGTGALMTHALYPFVKGSVAYSINYVFMMSN